MSSRVTIETRQGRILAVRVDEEAEVIIDMLGESMADPHAHPIELGELVIMSDNIGAVLVVEEVEVGVPAQSLH